MRRFLLRTLEVMKNDLLKMLSRYCASHGKGLTVKIDPRAIIEPLRALLMIFKFTKKLSHKKISQTLFHFISLGRVVALAKKISS